MEELKWIEVRRCPSRVEAEQRALVLVAVGISARLEPRDSGVGLLVAEEDAMRARAELAAFDRENRPSFRVLETERPFAEGLPGAIIFTSVLLFLHAAKSQYAFSVDWLSAGEAEAGLIKSGEWWRVLTALGLHADLGHLLGNIVIGSLLGLFLAQSLGTGLAWLAILLAAGIGNGLDALAHPAAYASIGASTAGFATVGILSVLELRRRPPPWTQGLRRWLPLAGGLMLLVFLGIGGEHTALGAHFAGFFVGCVLGSGLSLAGPLLPQGMKAQYVFGAAAIALFVLAWLIALETVAADSVSLFPSSGLQQ